jgi:hypothetical protein
VLPGGTRWDTYTWFVSPAAAVTVSTPPSTETVEAAADAGANSALATASAIAARVIV